MTMGFEISPGIQRFEIWVMGAGYLMWDIEIHN